MAPEAATNVKSRDEYCCVPQCNGNARIHKELSFHHIPSEKTSALRKQWIIAIRRDEGPFFKVNKLILRNTSLCQVTKSRQNKCQIYIFMIIYVLFFNLIQHKTKIKVFLRCTSKKVSYVYNNNKHLGIIVDEFHNVQLAAWTAPCGYDCTKKTACCASSVVDSGFDLQSG